ncbi:MAG: arylesterase, partial [Bacteroidota bacterium]
MYKLLKFRYFLILLFLVSCGGKTNEKTSEQRTSEKGDTIATTDTIAKKVILFFGDSLTAGYGLDPEEAFPAVIQGTLDSLQLNYMVV